MNTVGDRPELAEKILRYLGRRQIQYFSWRQTNPSDILKLPLDCRLYPRNPAHEAEGVLKREFGSEHLSKCHNLSPN